jgi:hypothetical protein
MNNATRCAIIALFYGYKDKTITYSGYEHLVLVEYIHAEGAYIAVTAEDV